MQQEKENIFISRLNQAIKESNLNKGEIAQRSGIHRSTISRLLSGKTPTPTSDNLHNVASVLNVPTSWLLGESDNKVTINGELDQIKESIESIEQQWRITISEYAKDLSAEQILDLLDSIIKTKPQGWEIIDQGLRALIRKKLKTKQTNK